MINLQNQLHLAGQWLKGTFQEGANMIKNKVFWNQGSKMYVAKKKAQYKQTLQNLSVQAQSVVSLGNKMLTVVVVLLPMYIVYKYVIKK